MEPEHHETLAPSSFPALQHCAHYLPSRRARSLHGLLDQFTGLSGLFSKN